MRSTRRQASGAFGRIGTKSSVSYGSRLSASFETKEEPMNEYQGSRLRLVAMSLTPEEAALIVRWGSEIKELSGDQWRAEEQALLNRFRKASAAA
jgi:hypothetical protein